MNLKERLQNVESRIKEKRRLAVILVDADEDGLYHFGGKDYTPQELEAWTAHRGTEVVIIDDL